MYWREGHSDPARFLSLTLLPFLVGLSFLACTGCQDSTHRPEPQDASWETHCSGLDRELSPDVSSEDLAELVRGDREFVLELHGLLRNGTENLLLSPLSMRIAFAMVYAGARGETAVQMASALRYTLDQTQLHESFNALDLELQRRNDPGNGEDEDPVELYIANAFWGRSAYPFLASYLDLLAVNYGSGVQSLDFPGYPDRAREIINAWVTERTRERIRDLLPPGSITPATVAVLTNTLYLKAPWALPFDEDQTSESLFYLLDGSLMPTAMMHQRSELAYGEGEDYQAIELPFRREELSMIVLVPSTGHFDAFEAELDGDKLTRILDELHLEQVMLTFPKFSFEYACQLRETLIAMGMIQPFSPSADFSGIVEGREIYISEAYHKTFISIDEIGAEAAAATAVVMEETFVPGESKEVTVDRPFLFLIRDRLTGAILFFGRVMNPAS